MAKITLVLLSALAALSATNGYKILVMFPMPARSHGILGDGIVRHLLNAGHEVTYVTSFFKNSTNPMLHEVDVSSSLTSFMERLKQMLNIKSVLEGKSSYDWMKNFLWFMGHTIASTILEDENLQNLFADKNQQFDVVISEWFFNDLYSSVGGIYDAPFIWLSTIEPHWMILSLIDETLNPSYNGYDVTERTPFTFGQRVQELWFTVKQTILKYTLSSFLDQWSYNKLIAPHIEARGRVAPSFTELQFNSSLVLGNSHVSMGVATRLPQNYINIGGYHIEDNVKPLPDDLKKIIDSAKHGVIFFSMGSNLNSKELPELLRNQILDVFGSLKQTVLWKFEEKLKNLPENVHILDWAPQQSILAHPNVVLFITHGGLLSTTETIYAGKPIIGIPVFTDQFVNVARAVSRGFALKVQLSYTMAAELKDAIEEILDDPKYTQQAKYLSFIHHDRPTKPGPEMVHWVEHVVKTQGAPHLRSPALLVPWYQKIYLDLAVLIAIVVLTLKRGYKYGRSILTKKNGQKVKTK